jgi:CRP-like cAMP-binding protein
MQPENLTQVLREHSFLSGLSDGQLDLLVGCATNAHFNEGAYILHEGQLANKFYLIRAGRVALETDVVGHGHITIQTLGKGDVLGWSWMIAPFRIHFTGRALSEVRALALDAECLRKKCEEDHTFGFEIMKHLTQVIHRRLDATRTQLLDLYAIEAGIHV